MKSIERTLKYFDIFDYPLRQDEIWQWLWQGDASRDEFEKSLCGMLAAGEVEERESYYFLPGRSALVDRRKRREAVSLGKIEKARRMAWLLSWIAGVKMIAIASDVAYLNADEEADIDFFIVAEKGKIWSVRWWSVALMKALRQRPNQKTIKNKICLSYFVDEEHLNLEPTRLGEKDIHLTYLLSEYLPVYDEGGYWRRFAEANRWMRNYLPNFDYLEESKKYMIGARGRGLKRIFNRVGLGQGVYKKMQLERMAPALRECMNREDKKVIVKEGILKLHVNDRRAEVNSKLN